ncbi:hypothetical protein J6A34_08005 [bacterium]|nr:hypothetical protein [bacterium]
MDNFEIKLKEFAEKCEDLKNQEFENFGQMEQTYCNLINEGNQLRQFLLQNPELCDKNSLLVLTNQVPDISLLDEKYKSLANIIQLTIALLQKYSEYVQTLLAEQKFEEAINIYNQMYNFTRNPIYKKNIAEIYCLNLNDNAKALEVCNSIYDYAINNAQFCRLYAKIYSFKSDVEKALSFNKMADELDMLTQVKEFISKEDYIEAINVYDSLFTLTNNYNYQKEIANIHAVCLSDIDKAISLYKDLEKHLGEDPQYWWQLSELYDKKNIRYKQVLSIQKAIKLELKNKEASAC